MDGFEDELISHDLRSVSPIPDVRCTYFCEHSNIQLLDYIAPVAITYDSSLFCRTLVSTFISSYNGAVRPCSSAYAAELRPACYVSTINLPYRSPPPRTFCIAGGGPPAHHGSVNPPVYSPRASAFTVAAGPPDVRPDVRPASSHTGHVR